MHPRGDEGAGRHREASSCWRTPQKYCGGYAEGDLPYPRRHDDKNREAYSTGRRELVEPNGRVSGWRAVNAVRLGPSPVAAALSKNVGQLRDLMGDCSRGVLRGPGVKGGAGDDAMIVPADVTDGSERAGRRVVPARRRVHEASRDSVRRYMLPVLATRTDWASTRSPQVTAPRARHVWASRRTNAPHKVLAECCPRARSTEALHAHGPRRNSTRRCFKLKSREDGRPVRAMLDYCSEHRRCVTSWSPVPTRHHAVKNLEGSSQVLRRQHRGIPAATKALMGLPQHWSRTTSSRRRRVSAWPLRRSLPTRATPSNTRSR